MISVNISFFANMFLTTQSIRQRESLLHNPTGPGTIVKPHHQEIGDIVSSLETPCDGFRSSKLRKGRLGTS